MPPLTPLGAIAHATMLDVACSRCERRGRLSVARLLVQHGPDAPVRDAWRDLADDCPRRHHPGAGMACDLYAPGLAELLKGP